MGNLPFQGENRKDTMNKILKFVYEIFPLVFVVYLRLFVEIN